MILSSRIMPDSRLTRMNPKTEVGITLETLMTTEALRK